MRNTLASASSNPLPSLRSLLSAVSGPAGLTGKTVLITGASSGIGRAATELLAGRGAHVLAVARDGDRPDKRTTAINYFGAVRLTMGLLSHFQRRGNGHFVNVATWGTTAGVMPKFTAYHTSTAAPAAFGQSLGAELRGTDIAVSTLGFLLVRTEMISPTSIYDTAPALTPDAAAQWIFRAIRDRPIELHPAYAGILRSTDMPSPRLTDAVVSATGN